MKKDSEPQKPLKEGYVPPKVPKRENSEKGIVKTGGLVPPSAMKRKPGGKEGK